MADRKLEDHPEDLRTLRSLLARRLGLTVEPTRLTVWERAVRRWKPLRHAELVILALSFLFLAWLGSRIFRD